MLLFFKVEKRGPITFCSAALAQQKPSLTCLLVKLTCLAAAIVDNFQLIPLASLRLWLFQNSFEPLLLFNFPASVHAVWLWNPLENCVHWRVAGMAKLGLRVEMWLVQLSCEVKSGRRPQGSERGRGCENRYPLPLPLIPPSPSPLFSPAAGSRLQPLSLPHKNRAVHLASVVGGKQGEIRKFRSSSSLRTRPRVPTGNILISKRREATSWRAFPRRVSLVSELLRQSFRSSC